MDITNSIIKKEVDRSKENTFIDQEVEQMPLSFKSSVFKSLHGIHPLFLSFKKPRSIQSVSKDKAMSNSEGGWALEKEFLTLNDDFFIFYLSFSFVLCLVIGLVKGAIVPKVDSLIATLVTFAASLTLILICVSYSCQTSGNVSSLNRQVVHFINIRLLSFPS